MEIIKSENVTLKLTFEEFEELKMFLGSSELYEYRDSEVCKKLLADD